MITVRQLGAYGVTILAAHGAYLVVLHIPQVCIKGTEVFQCFRLDYHPIPMDGPERGRLMMSSTSSAAGVR